MYKGRERKGQKMVDGIGLKDQGKGWHEYFMRASPKHAVVVVVCRGCCCYLHIEKRPDLSIQYLHE